MYSSVFVTLLFTLTAASNIHQALREGLCLCVADHDVYALTGPGPDNLIIGTLQVNDCFVSKGGLFHDGSQTWYELQAINGQTAWVDGLHLRAKNGTDCPGKAAISFPNPICVEGGQIYQEGDVVPRSGQQCTCRNSRIQCSPETVG